MFDGDCSITLYDLETTLSLDDMYRALAVSGFMGEYAKLIAKKEKEK